MIQDVPLAPREDLLRGLLKIRQPQQGPRVNVDTILLAGFTVLRPGEKALELGCAHGGISLILARRYQGSSITGLEIQPQLAQLAQVNARENSLEDRFQVLWGDLRDHRRLFAPQSFDVVTANPPYEDPGQGQPSPQETSRLARQGEGCTLAQVCDAARFLLRNRGRLYMIMRSRRLAELLELLRQRRLEPKKLLTVHSRQDQEASVFLLEAVRAGGVGMAVLPPLVLYGPDGGYTAQLERFYREEPPRCP